MDVGRAIEGLLPDEHFEVVIGRWRGAGVCVDLLAEHTDVVSEIVAEHRTHENFLAFIIYPTYVYIFQHSLKPGPGPVEFNLFFVALSHSSIPKSI